MNRIENPEFRPSAIDPDPSVIPDDRFSEFDGFRWISRRKFFKIIVSIAGATAVGCGPTLEEAADVLTPTLEDKETATVSVPPAKPTEPVTATATNTRTATSAPPRETATPPETPEPTAQAIPNITELSGVTFDKEVFLAQLPQEAADAVHSLGKFDRGWEVDKADFHVVVTQPLPRITDPSKTVDQAKRYRWNPDKKSWELPPVQIDATSAQLNLDDNGIGIALAPGQPSGFFVRNVIRTLFHTPALSSALLLTDSDAKNAYPPLRSSGDRNSPEQMTQHMNEIVRFLETHFSRTGGVVNGRVGAWFERGRIIDLTQPVVINMSLRDEPLSAGHSAPAGYENIQINSGRVILPAAGYDLIDPDSCDMALYLSQKGQVHILVNVKPAAAKNTLERFENADDDGHDGPPCETMYNAWNHLLEQALLYIMIKAATGKWTTDQIRSDQYTRHTTGRDYLIGFNPQAACKSARVVGQDLHSAMFVVTKP